MLYYFFKYYNILIPNLSLDLKYSEFTKRYTHWFQSSIPDHIIHWLENTRTLCLKITLNESPEELIFSISDQRKHTDKVIEAYLVTEKLPLTFTDKINLYTQQHALNKIVLNMNEKYFFIRDFLIPKSAKNHLDKLSIIEIEQKTPFKLDDIYFTQFQDQKYNASDKLKICQVIIRKDILKSLLEKYSLKIDNIDIIRPVINSANFKKTPEIILEKKAAHPGKVNFAIKNILLMSLVFLITGFMALYIKQQRTTDELAEKILFLSAKAAKVREMADHASTEERLLLAVRHQKSTKILLVDVIAEITKSLPDSSYLTEIHLREKGPEQRIIDLAGFADVAVKLPALFDKSSILRDATLTAPITADPNEKKELFSIQAKIKDFDFGVKR